MLIPQVPLKQRGMPYDLSVTHHLARLQKFGSLPKRGILHRDMHVPEMYLCPVRGNEADICEGYVHAVHACNYLQEYAGFSRVIGTP